MGKALSTANDYGSISIQLEHPKYTAGDQVNGWIYLSLVRNFPSNVLHLIISGKEKVRLAISNTVQGESGSRQNVTIHTDKNEFFSHNFPLFSQTGNFFPYGQYSFPFSFKLLDNLPGTFIDEWNEHGEKCFAKTTYKLWAGMKESSGELAIFTKQVFSVDQRFEHSTGAQHKNYQKNIKGFCYKDLGEVRLACRFEKDKFFVGENALMNFEVDNTNSKSDVRNIECSLIQTSKYGTAKQPNLKFKRQVLSSVHLIGVKAGESRMGMNSFPITLLIKTNNESQATSTHNLINNTFELSISTNMNDCLCCEAQPSTTIDVKVFNVPPTNYVQFQPQANWNPQIMTPYVCTISNEYRMTDEMKNQVFNLNRPMDMNYPPQSNGPNNYAPQTGNMHNQFPPQGPNMGQGMSPYNASQPANMHNQYAPQGPGMSPYNQPQTGVMHNQFAPKGPNFG